MTQNDSKGPSVKVPPPLIFILSMAAAFGLEQLYPLAQAAHPLGQLMGGVLLLASCLVLVHLLVIFRRRQTAIEPWKPTSSIITSGYYGYSRNPIYVAFCGFPIGLGLLLASPWLLLSTLPACLGVYWLAIRREEAYLLAKFPKEYGAYLSSVRRWL
ncbi:isoprenylcysteine carboxylmethyltransferase family protein [Shewanella insulae]|uniref:methyltransferase family protein n=1 Tax=Shewanella insulae TaxID=2681496 RepID=UPI001EFDF567|nr:isoprenylcysteine carboxylmethyltransferase family protein [Shewanella insulae]MCG9739946.1 isoprenylcysteine carboxylmethyltransferase family protein [Shewanella insulae]